MKNRYQILISVKKLCQFITLEKFGIETHTCEVLVPNPHTCEDWYQIITDVKNWHLIVTDVSDKTVKIRNRLQSATDFGVIMVNMRNTHVCDIKFDLVRIFHKV